MSFSAILTLQKYLSFFVMPVRAIVRISASDRLRAAGSGSFSVCDWLIYEDALLIFAYFGQHLSILLYICSHNQTC